MKTQKSAKKPNTILEVQLAVQGNDAQLSILQKRQYSFDPIFVGTLAWLTIEHHLRAVPDEQKGEILNASLNAFAEKANLSLGISPNQTKKPEIEEVIDAKAEII